MPDSHGFVGCYLTYPDKTDSRRAEGGRRLSGVRRESQTDLPLVTVITVCWNSAKTIEQSIRSIISQTYKNIEYIIVDGASEDATLDIIRKYEADVDYYVSEPDDGLYYAMNKGLELAQGDYILFLNSDDWYTPDAVEALVDAKDYSGCDFVSALALYVNEENGEHKPLRTMPFNDSQYLRMSIRHETMLLPAALYDQLGPYDTRFRILSDREYATRLFKNCCTHYEIQRPLLNFRVNGVSNTNLELLHTEQDLILLLEFPFLSAQERATLNNRAAATAKTFIDAANAHLDQPEFVKACRAFLVDHKANHGAKWQLGDIHEIAASAPEVYPSVSVIIPFYAAEKTIRASLDSILAQTLTDFEVICVNDCAIDSAQNIVDEYQSRDPRIRVLKNPRNLGLGASRNAGVRAARGRYIFHIDPDDTIPPTALKILHDLALAHGSALVKGAFRANQMIHGRQSSAGAIKYPCGIADRLTINTTLAEKPSLLQSTEGHWSILYQAEFARTLPYPTDLKMGQDSIFLVNALVRAPSITLTPEVVYNYQVNPKSAMNQFSARMFFDALEWRRRAWRLLADFKQQSIGEYLLFNYWNVGFFERLPQQLTKPEVEKFYDELRKIFQRADYYEKAQIRDAGLQETFDAVMHQPPFSPTVRDRKQKSQDKSRTKLDADPALNIATFVAWDHGGAGQGSQRRVEALRNRGLNAEIYCLFKKTNKPYVKRAPLHSALGAAIKSDDLLNRAWREYAVVTKKEQPDLRARELFSKTGSLVDFAQLGPVFDQADVVHLHWVAGMFDYESAPAYLADKPVVWTLADMNAFTGGCHYSEGCDGYKYECRSCPLLGGSDLAHQNWKIKKRAYERIRNLHIICPSQWLADRAAASSLLSERPIHVIPNALPVHRFQPINKLAARMQLGLPLDKKLIVFGAASLQNKRKGGDILADSIRRLKSVGQGEDVEGLFFGKSELDIGIKAHNMGHIDEERRLSLIYAAADVFAFPSREDNAPLTVPESLLSGTPVVGFPVGNVPDLVTHRETGYLARYEDAQDFMEGLSWALEAPRSSEALNRSIKCYLAAVWHNDPDKAARRHIGLYKNIIRDTLSPSTNDL